MPRCDNCEAEAPRLFTRNVTVSSDPNSAAMGDIEQMRLCQTCSGVSDEDLHVDDDTLNYRSAA